MRLSRALGIVLLLHLIALVGVYVFTYIKDTAPVAKPTRRPDVRMTASRSPAPAQPKARESSPVPAQVNRSNSKPKESGMATTGPRERTPPPLLQGKPPVASNPRAKSPGVATVNPAKARSAQDEALDLIGSQAN